MRLVSYNIMKGGEGRADPLAEVILAQKSDIVALIETDDPAALHRIASRLHMDFIEARGCAKVCALLSRWPIVRTINHGVLRAALSESAVLEAMVVEPTGVEWIVGVVDAPKSQLAFALDAFSLHRSAGRPHLLAGNPRLESNDHQIRISGYLDAFDVKPPPLPHNFPTQNPDRRADCCLLFGFSPDRIQSVWVERDRLARYASDHFPIGVEIE
ncbi:MAG: endonuclease/exonuclease/phosphatase family protein [Tepidisphaeraceae bacterium]